MLSEQLVMMDGPQLICVFGWEEGEGGEEKVAAYRAIRPNYLLSLPEKRHVLLLVNAFSLCLYRYGEGAKKTHQRSSSDWQHAS